MAKYEVALIIRPELEEEAQQTLIEQLSALLTAEGGQIDNVETWGRRRLSYPIRKVNEGFYYFVQGEFPAQVLSELDRTAKLSEDILRYMVTRQDA